MKLDLVDELLQRSPGVGREMNKVMMPAAFQLILLQRSPGVGREMNI